MTDSPVTNDLDRAMTLKDGLRLAGSVEQADVRRRQDPDPRADQGGRGWVFQDIPALKLLEASAERLAATIAELAADRPSLSAAFSGRVLEIGGGLAAFSLALRRNFPTAQYRVDDSHPGAVAHAQRDVVEAGCVDRIDVKLRDLIHIEERAAYSAIWLPAPILPVRGASAALSRLAMALRPGGHLIVGNCPQLGSDAETVMNGARLLRSTGQIWSLDELTTILRLQGYRGFERASCAGGVDLVICQRA